MKKADLAGTLPRRFGELCQLRPPRPIRSRSDFVEVVELVDRLTSIPRPTRDQEDYLETLTLLVEAHEEQHGLGAPLRGLAAVRYLMDQNGLTPSDLSRLLGDESRSLGGRLLRGERELSKAHVKALCERFHVSADIFL